MVREDTRATIHSRNGSAQVTVPWQCQHSKDSSHRNVHVEKLPQSTLYFSICDVVLLQKLLASELFMCIMTIFGETDEKLTHAILENGIMLRESSNLF